MSLHGKIRFHEFFYLHANTKKLKKAAAVKK